MPCTNPQPFFGRTSFTPLVSNSNSAHQLTSIMRLPKPTTKQLSSGTRVPTPTTHPSSVPARSGFGKKNAQRHQRLRTFDDRPPPSSLDSQKQEHFDNASFQLYFEERLEELGEDLKALTRNSPYSLLASFYRDTNPLWNYNWKDLPEKPWISGTTSGETTRSLCRGQYHKMVKDKYLHSRRDIEQKCPKLHRYLVEYHGSTRQAILSTLPLRIATGDALTTAHLLADRKFVKRALDLRTTAKNIFHTAMFMNKMLKELENTRVVSAASLFDMDYFQIKVQFHCKRESQREALRNVRRSTQHVRSTVEPSISDSGLGLWKRISALPSRFHGSHWLQLILNPRETQTSQPRHNSASTEYNRAGSARVKPIHHFYDHFAFLDKHSQLWPASILRLMHYEMNKMLGRLHGQRMPSVLNKHYMMTRARAHQMPVPVVHARVAQWIAIRKLQAQIHITAKELDDMVDDLFDFQIFQYTNTSVRISQGLIDKSRAIGMEMLEREES